MVKKTKILAIVTCIIILLLFLTYCAYISYVTYESSIRHKNEMLILTEAIIPGLDVRTRDWVKIEEKDDYGRYLYSFITTGEKTIAAYIIAQQEDVENEMIYYYPEYNIVFLDHIEVHNLSEAEQQQIEQLKKQNDWNRPLEYSKMVSISTKE